MEVIFRSAKPIAVMIAGLFICKRYTMQKYFFMVMIVVGVSMFKFFESSKDKSGREDNWLDISNSTQLTGIALLMFSLCMDGALSAIQDRIRAINSPTPRQMMLSMTAYICAFTVAVAFVNGEIFEVYDFVQKYPSVIWQLSILSIAGAIGQIFIFTMDSSFGSLATSITSTVRRLFSIVFSIIFFQYPSTPGQWIGAILVFSALIADIIFGRQTLEQPSNELSSMPENEAIEIYNDFETSPTDVSKKKETMTSDNHIG